MLVIPHRFKKIGLHNIVVRRIFSDILLVLGLKNVEKHWSRKLLRLNKNITEINKICVSYLSTVFVLNAFSPRKIFIKLRETYTPDATRNACRSPCEASITAV
jgi:hypothetical protein